MQVENYCQRAYLSWSLIQEQNRQSVPDPTPSVTQSFEYQRVQNDLSHFKQTAEGLQVKCAELLAFQKEAKKQDEKRDKEDARQKVRLDKQDFQIRRLEELLCKARVEITMLNGKKEESVRIEDFEEIQREIAVIKSRNEYLQH